MLSLIYELNSDGKIEKKAEYTISPKQALINYIMQFKRKNYNTWAYPDNITDIRESTTKKDHYYFDDGDLVIASYPA